MSASGASQDIRRHILEAAHPLLVSKGFTAVGLAEVLAAAKVPKGSFYYYFGSKEAFGQAVLDAYFADYQSRMDALLAAPGSAAQRLMAYFQDWLASQTDESAVSRCLVVKLGAEVCDLSESMRAALERGTQGIIDRLERCLDAGREDGSLTAPEHTRALALSLYQTWLGAGLLAKITRDRTPLDTAMADTRRRLGIS
ncbi:TetR/AcrR family transcriptional regulator [Myxococcus faecalis]|uniref:TetR/AcrR family transcriptional regulator n=1 Tax=Myxococcus faecalis TaxID=3115646 RepID=UPI003CEF84C6